MAKKKTKAKPARAPARANAASKRKARRAAAPARPKTASKRKGSKFTAPAKPATAVAGARGLPASPLPLKRKLGLRGAAPWAARHAAKHAAEARARAAEPPLPGSARATIRTPAAADDIKQKIGLLHQALVQIKQLRKNVDKNFYEIGCVLRDVRDARTYEAKGYGTFEAFLEREIDLGKTMALRLVKIVQTFLRNAATELGKDRLINALIAIEVPESMVSTRDLSAAKLPAAPVSTSALPLRPPGR